jgi:lipopolysaccharide heptosyltransferase III
LLSAASTPARSRLRLALLRVAAHGVRAAAPPRARRVLLLRPDHIGDVLLSTPAVALLRASLPSAHLTYLVGPWSAQAARRGPPVDEVRTLAYPGFARRSNANLLEPYALLLRVATQLRRERFDMAVVLRGDHWWGGLLAVVAGIPLRVGGDTPETGPLLSHTYCAPSDEPWARQALGIARLAVRAVDATVVEPIDVRQFTLSESAQVAASELWLRHGLGERVVALHPSAGAPLKSWPAQRWAELAGALVETGLQVVLVGAPDDAALLRQIAGRARGCAPVLCGQSLEVSAAVYARSGLVVTVDSGAGHLAAAVGARTVRLYGPAPASVFGPWPSDRASQRVLATQVLACAPCGYLEAPPCGARKTPACMLALGVDDVLNAVRLELDRS